MCLVILTIFGFMDVFEINFSFVSNTIDVDNMWIVQPSNSSNASPRLVFPTFNFLYFSLSTGAAVLVPPVPVGTSNDDSSFENSFGDQTWFQTLTSRRNFNALKQQRLVEETIERALLTVESDSISTIVYLSIGRRFETKERMSQIVFVQSHVTMCTKIEIETSSTFPSHSDDSMFPTSIADHIRVTNTDRCVVVNAQIICWLISDTITRNDRNRMIRLSSDDDNTSST